MLTTIMQHCFSIVNLRSCHDLTRVVRKLAVTDLIWNDLKLLNV